MTIAARARMLVTRLRELRVADRAARAVAATITHMDFAENIFRAYDIRGITPDELGPEVAHAVGRVFADFLEPGKVGVGRDMRTDSAELAEAVKAGLIDQGREVVDIGLVTSDMIYFAVGEWDLAGGAMITASHNPGKYDGIKLTREQVKPVGEETGLLDLRNAIRDDRYEAAKPGGSSQDHDMMDDWVAHALDFAGGTLAPLRIGIDCGNGMAGLVVPVLDAKTDLEISALYLELDGTFPNHVANPLIDENVADLVKLVTRENLQAGIAFDGDGDRAFMIDENGTKVSGSLLGALLAEKFLAENPGATILYNAICSRVVPETIEANGGTAIRTRVGHSFIKAEMRKHNGVFAAEHSGHFYFRDNFNADSGLIAAVSALGVMTKTGRPLSELVAPFEKYANSGEINSEVADTTAVLDKLRDEFSDGDQDELDGLTVNYPDWWFNVRLSNTEPVVRLNVEAAASDLCDEKTAEILSVIRA